MCVYVCVRMCMCVKVGGQPAGVGSPLYLVDSRYLTEVLRLGSRRHYPLSHFTGLSLFVNLILPTVH